MAGKGEDGNAGGESFRHRESTQRRARCAPNQPEGRPYGVAGPSTPHRQGRYGLLLANKVACNDVGHAWRQGRRWCNPQPRARCSANEEADVFVFVSWVFLILSGGSALFTLNALFPQRGSSLRVGLSFFNAWLTTELALHQLLLQGIVLGVMASVGALEHWPGQLGGLFALASWGGLLHLVREAQRDGAVVAAALDDGLGPGASDDIDVELRRHMNPSLDWRLVLWPFRRSGRDILRRKDVTYSETGNPRHRLDIYHRRDLAPGAPILLQIHGGAWMIGDKRTQGRPLIHHLARRGWLCIAINYSLSPKATWPEHLIDCKRALAWIRAHASEYGGDPSFVVATGGSAGGHLAAMVGLTANDPALQPGFEEVDTTVAAFVAFYGVFDWTDRQGVRGKRDLMRPRLERFIVKADRDHEPEVFDRASPMSRCEGPIPPAMILHGKKDTLAPVQEAQAFASRLQEFSEEPVVYVEFAGAHHAFDVFPSVRTLHAIHGVEVFASWVATHRRHMTQRGQARATRRGEAQCHS